MLRTLLSGESCVFLALPEVVGADGLSLDINPTMTSAYEMNAALVGFPWTRPTLSGLLKGEGFRRKLVMTNAYRAWGPVRGENSKGGGILICALFK